jgi:hypothetical protein
MSADPKPTRSWRDALPVHPAAEIFPLMKDESPVEFAELIEDIRKNGLQTLVTLWAAANGQSTQLLDGRNRLDASEAAGVELRIREEAGIVAVEAVGEFGPRKISQYAHGVDPNDFVISANIRRRHLTAEQKRDLIEKVLKAKPEASNLQIAKQVKADDKTVGKVRRELEARSEIPNVSIRTDSKGRQQPTRKKRRNLDDFEADKRAREAKTVEPETISTEEAREHAIGAAAQKILDKFGQDDVRWLLDTLRSVTNLPHPVLSRLEDILVDAGVGRFTDDEAGEIAQVPIGEPEPAKVLAGA